MMQGPLAERLRILRARKGLTLTEASERIGITRHTLRSLERGGQDPHYPTLRKIAEGYDVPVEELLEEPVPLGEAPGEAGLAEPPPRVSKERLQEHFDDVRQEEVDYLNWTIADFWRLALPGEKPIGHFVPDAVDTDRVWSFLEHAFSARNVFAPEEAERIRRGALKKALAG